MPKAHHAVQSYACHGLATGPTAAAPSPTLRDVPWYRLTSWASEGIPRLLQGPVPDLSCCVLSLLLLL